MRLKETLRTRVDNEVLVSFRAYDEGVSAANPDAGIEARSPEAVQFTPSAVGEREPRASPGP